MSRRIGEFRWAVCSPDYLEKFGEPQTLTDLNRHTMAAYSLSRNRRPDRWAFSEAKRHKMSVNGTINWNRVLNAATHKQERSNERFEQS
jgi:hypothetical protein